MKHCIVLFIFIISLFSIYGNEQLFINYSTQQGLTHKTVFCLHEDNQGFIWIGTTNGLNRFDGYQFKQFYYDPSDSTSICGNFIIEITENKNGLLYIATTQGYCYYNPLTEKFHKIKFPNEKEPVIPLRICASDNGTIWGISKNNILVEMSSSDPDIGNCYKLETLLKTGSDLSSWNIEYYNDSLWICTSKGILKVHTDTRQAALLTNKQYEFKTIKEIRFDKDGKILLVDQKHTLYCLHGDSHEVSTITKENFYNAGVNLQYLTDAFFDSKETIWVCGSPGLFKITPDKTVLLTNTETGSNYNFDNIRTNWIIRDRKGNMWIGTMDYGVFVQNNSNKSFSHIVFSKKNNEGIPISGFTQIGNKIIYGNTYGAFLATDGDKNHKKILDKSISSIHQLSDKVILIVGIDAYYKYYINTGKIEIQDSLTGYTLRSYIDSQGILWILQWGNGVKGINLNTGDKYFIDVDTLNSDNNIVFSMNEDNDSSLWLGMFGNGLIHVKDPRSSNPRIIKYPTSPEHSADGSNVILDMYDDKKGNLWLATNGGGLQKFNKKSKEYTVFTTQQGLKNNVVESVIADNDGNIWFTTSIVSKYDTKKNKFTHYDIANGINSKYFHFYSYRDTIGNIFLGDNQGFLTFNPSKIKEKNKPNSPILTSFEIYGNEIKAGVPFEDVPPTEMAINYSKNITLPFKYNSIKLEFASLHILENRNITYAYKLEGAENRWNYTELNEYWANYSGLRPGKYIFRVKASNDRKNWSNEKTIAINIIPPWWSTLWFKIMIILSFIIIIGLVIYIRFRNIKKINIQLENKVNEKTSHLKLANNVLSNQYAKLNEQQAVLQMKNEELTEAINLKDKLIGVISHDFKNPLNSLLGIVNYLKSPKNTSDTVKYNKIVSSAEITIKKLVAQMVTVLDWAQDNLQNIKIKHSEVSLESLLVDAIQLLQNDANKKNIIIDTQIDCTLCAYIDPRMIHTVFRNLLHNAIKYSHEGNTIIITINEDDNMHEVSFVDTGIGMSKEKQDSLFSSYNPENISFGTAAEKGTGLGLQICKTFIEKNSGTISVKSELNKGSVFSVLLPKGNKRVSSSRISVNQNLTNTSPIIENIGDKQYSILLIDDNKELVRIFDEVFADNFKVIKAYDGKAGLYLAENMMPDIIVSDIYMPNINGIDLCKTIRKMDIISHIPIILMSSEKRQNIELDCYASGANDFLEKPIDTKVLRHKVFIQLHLLKKEQENSTNNDNTFFNLPESANDVIIKKIIELMKINLENPEFDVNAIATQLGLSRVQLWRKTKSYMDKTPSELIRDLRMKKAIEMLNTKKYRISEIAYAVGYNDANVFQKNFSKVFGKTPSEYID